MCGKRQRSLSGGSVSNHLWRRPFPRSATPACDRLHPMSCQPHGPPRGKFPRGPLRAHRCSERELRRHLVKASTQRNGLHRVYRTVRVRWSPPLVRGIDSQRRACVEWYSAAAAGSATTSLGVKLKFAMMEAGETFGNCAGGTKASANQGMRRLKMCLRN